MKPTTKKRKPRSETLATPANPVAVIVDERHLRRAFAVWGKEIARMAPIELAKASVAFSRQSAAQQDRQQAAYLFGLLVRLM